MYYSYYVYSYTSPCVTWHYVLLTSTLPDLSQDFLGKSDPYLEFAKENPDGTFTTTHRTQVSRHMHINSHS